MLSPLFFLLSCLVFEVTADIHHLFASSYRSPTLFALEYDTVTNALVQIANFTAHAGHPLLSFSYDRSTLYAAERDGWSSYQVLSPSELYFQSNLTLRGRCDGGNYKHGTTSILAGQKVPYNIYGSGRSPCGNIISSKVDGSFDRIIQNVTYKPESRVGGMAFDTTNNYLYSADTSGNGIWIHKIDPQKGTLTAAKFVTHPEPNARPRRLLVHPQSNYLYLLLSKSNKVAVYSIKMGSNGPTLAYTGKSYSLVPPGTVNTNYRGTELALSADNSILYLTSRFRVQRRDDEDDEGEQNDEEGEDADTDDARVREMDNDELVQKSQDRKNENMGMNEANVDKRNVQGYVFKAMFTRKTTSSIKRQFDWLTGLLGSNANNQAGSRKPANVLPGYLTALQLSQDRSDSLKNGPGYPLGIAMQVQTSTSGGKSNFISAAPWSPEYVALTDSEKGLVQVWRFEGVGPPLAYSPNTNLQPPKAPNQPFGPDPPLQPDPPLSPDQPAAQEPQPQPKPQSQPQPQPAPQIQTQPVPPPALQPAASPQPKVVNSNSNIPPKGLPPGNPLTNGGKLSPWISKPGQAQPPSQGQGVSVRRSAHSAKKGQSPQNPFENSGLSPSPRIPKAKRALKSPRPQSQYEATTSTQNQAEAHLDTIRKRQGLINIRTSIVAEWKAPAFAIGVGDPAAPRGSNRENDDKTGKKVGWGRGCCSHAVWYD